MDKEVVIIGVGHIFNIAPKIRDIIEKEAPQAIGVELDEKRYQALKSGKKGRKPSIYHLFSLSQSIMAKKFGVFAGEEMLAAIETAVEKGIPSYFIDADSIYTLNKFWNSLSIKEKINIFISLFISLFLSKKRIEKEMEKVKNEEILQEMERNMPTLKKILIDDRNEYMAMNILNMLNRYDKVLVVVGEGHTEGLKNILQPYANIKRYHLKDYLNLSL